MASRVVPLEGGINFRDLGGYQSRDGRSVKWRKILRSGHLAGLTDADLNALQEIGITQVHDFRRSEEQDRTPSRPIRGEVISDYQIGVGSMSRFWDYLLGGKLTARSAHELVVNSYRDCVADVTPPYSRLLRFLLENSDNATLFHCAAGKDRTGMAAALILSALDVPRQTIIEDYMLTREHYDSAGLIELVEEHLRNANVDSWQRDWLIPYCTVHEENILAFYQGIDNNYGDIDNYLTNGLNLTKADIDTLKDRFLEP